MSYLAGSNCVATALEASTYYAMQQAGAIVTLNGSSYSASIISVYETFHVIKYTNISNGSAIWASPAFFAQPCVLTSNPFTLSLNDASVITSSILLVWALAWSFRAIKKHLAGGSPE
jgi:hypothetical protein